MGRTDARYDATMAKTIQKIGWKSHIWPIFNEKELKSDFPARF